MSTAPRSEETALGVAKNLGRVAFGFLIILGCFLAGEGLKRSLGLILPGSALGLFLLLILLAVGAIRLHWVEEASRLLIQWLPACFVVLYVGAAANRELWREWGVLIALVLTTTCVLLWGFAGRLAQAWLKRKGGRP